MGEMAFSSVGENRPSPLDIKSLYEIAHQKNYATDQPVMIIANSKKQIAGTVHPINAEYLTTEIITVAHEQAVRKEPLLQPE